jgi:Protein of unknown function (DUF3179)
MGKESRMRRGGILGTVVFLLIVAGIVGRGRFHRFWRERNPTGRPDHTVWNSTTETELDHETANQDPPPRLPETQPPAGLPIIPWGRRDHFPVIRNPKYLTADQADAAMAKNEPVLGLVLGGEARAYSTNQLNEHEMVIDTIAGTPVLVTY